MRLRFLGHAAFDLELGGLRLCIDPHKPGALAGRFQLPAIQGPFDALLRTHSHEDHAAWTPELGTQRWLDAPLELANLKLEARAAFHDAKLGTHMGLVRMVSLRAEGLRIVHSGDLGQADESDVAWLRGTDLLLIAAGGTWTLDGPAAADLARRCGARAVVPMHCADPRVDLALQPLDGFLSAWAGPAIRLGELTGATLASLTESTAIVLTSP